MDAVSAVGSSASTPSTISQLNSDEFLEIILQEMQSQDPLEPSDTSQMLEQLSSIMTIQSDSDMIDRLGELVGQNEFASASGLIGRLVSGLDADNQRVAGVVASVTQGRDGVSLRLDDGSSVAVDRVDTVLAAPEPTDEEGPGDPEDDEESSS